MIKVYRANAFSTFLRFPIITFINNWSTWYCCSVSSIFSSLSKIFNSPFNKELQKKEKSLLKEKQELNERLQKIDQDLKNLIK